MRMPLWIGLVLLAGVAVCVTDGAGADDFKAVVAPRDWVWPRDHGRHDGYKFEWWYFTGNVHDQSARKFGYQVTFFRSSFAPAAPTSRPSAWGTGDLYFAHAAVSDLQDQEFHYKDIAQRGRAGLAESSDTKMDVSLLNWSGRMADDGTISLKADDDGFAIDLALSGGTGPVLEGPGGVNAKGTLPGQASYYYSTVRLKTHGTLKVGGRSFTVDGLSWMDHEFSTNALGPHQVGWDWVGLQLDDGSELMIYKLRSDDGTDDFLSGSLIDRAGKPTYLSAADLSFKGGKPWHSNKTGADYPQRWAVDVKGRAMTVQSDMPGQELVTTGTTKVNYFEGSATVSDSSGKPIGSGYLEMTGYAR